MGYFKRTLNYLERITLSNLTHMMSIVDPIPIGVERLIDIGCLITCNLNMIKHDY